MTIGIYEKPSLLASILARESAERTDAGGVAKPDGLFAGKLDSLLSGTGQGARSEQTRAQALAEALNLQMLHTTMTLAGDAPSEEVPSPLFSRQTPAMQALLQAYNANQQESGGVPAQTPEAPSQLRELTETPSITPPQSPVPVTQGNQWLDPIIAKASRRYGVDVGLIKAVIKAESNFNPTAVSHAGARGLMQLMPGTARSLGVSDSFDPEQNVMAGTRFLRDLLDRYNGDLDSALAAYNWGPGNVDKRPDRLPRETRDYLVRVRQLYTSYTG